MKSTPIIKGPRSTLQSETSAVQPESSLELERLC